MNLAKSVFHISIPSLTSKEIEVFSHQVAILYLEIQKIGLLLYFEIQKSLRNLYFEIQIYIFAAVKYKVLDLWKR